MITLHHLNNSRSQRILWLLEELDLEYEVKHYQRDAALRAPKVLRAVHPLGKSPVITEGDTTVAESGAIIEYLLECHGNGRLQPSAGTPEWRRYRYWMHYAEGSLMPYLLMSLVFGKLPKSAPALLRPIVRGVANGVQRGFLGPNLKAHTEYLEAELGKFEWFAGPAFTAADVQMSYPIEAASTRAAQFGFGPNLHGFLDRIRARPAYQRALKKGGGNAPPGS